MDLAKIKSLIELVSQSQVTDLELVEGDTTLRISRAPNTTAAIRSSGPVEVPSALPPASPPAPAPEAARPPEQDGVVCAPSFGVLHRTPAPDAPPFVTAGAAVEAGQTLGLLEAMKVFTAITATEAGVVEAILVASGEEVEAGRPLFRIRR